jgi:hypothetical protein
MKKRFMKKLFLSALVLLALGVSVSAQTADEIITKYITAIGGADKWRQIKSIKVEGQAEVQGFAIPFTMQGVQMKGMRVDAEFQGNKIIDIVTPSAGWSQNPFSGKSGLTALTEEELKTKLDDLDIQDAFVDYKAKGSTIEFLGKDEEDGNEYFKVKITSKNGNEKTYFFDTKTSLAYKTESISKVQGQEVKSSIKYLDYQTLENGIKMPFKTDLGQMMQVVKKVTLNPTIDETIFKGN